MRDVRRPTQQDPPENPADAPNDDDRVSEERSTAVVTGGAGGMGLAVARLLAERHRVVLADLDSEALQGAALRLDSREVETALCDVADETSVERLASLASRRGPIAAVIHTAGISPQMGDPERIVRVNALGTVHIAIAFRNLLGAGSCLLNVASSAGHLPAAFPVPRHAYRVAETQPDRLVNAIMSRASLAPVRQRAGLAYALSKHFVIWYSRHLTGPLGAVGARVLSVSPGSFDTNMGRIEAQHGAGELARRSALGRYGAIDEIATVLAFAASPSAGYLTGTDILVDGGASAVMTWRDALALAR